MIADPASAPARPDLTFLRRRTARAAASAAASPAVSPVIVEEKPRSRGVDYVHHDAGGPLELSEPVGPSTAARPSTAPAPSTVGPAAAAAPASAPDPLNLADPLDLSARDVPRPAARPDVVTVAPEFEVPRVLNGTPRVLTPGEPTVTLTRLQSGIGALSIEAACSAAVGDLRLGCAWELRSGQSSVVQPSAGVVAAPPGSKRPVIVGDRSQFERLRIDLRQARELNRLAVYAYSESGGTLDWGGTLVVTTYGGARVELPLDRPPASSVQVLLSIFQIDGEFVIRAEMEQFNGPSIRQAVDAYDFYRITWIDTRTPLT